MRQVGKIKWFGGFNNRTNSINDYGFIQKDGGEDLFVHEKNLLCDEEDIMEGTFVSFEETERRGKLTAVNVCLLKEEKDRDIIIRCAESSDSKLWMNVIGKYVNELSDEEAVEFVLEKIKTFSSYENYKVNTLLQQLPDNLFYNSYKLRNKLDFYKHLQIISNIIEQNPEIDYKDEVIELLNKSSQFNSEIHLILPQKLFDLVNKDRHFRFRLPVNVHISTVLHLLENLYGENESKEYYAELKERMKSVQRNESMWDKIPNHIIYKADLVKFTPKERQFDIMLEVYKDNLHEDSVVSVLEGLLKEIPVYSRYTKLQGLDDPIKLNEKFFNMLSPVQQVELIWDTNPIPWAKMSNQAKLLYIFRMAKENRHVNELVEQGIKDGNPIITSILRIFWCKYNNGNKVQYFQELHNNIQDYAISIAKNLDDEIDLYPLLPVCPKGLVDYCEGKIWMTKEDKELGNLEGSNIFCPRRRKGCSKLRYDCGYISGTSHVYACTELPWEKWTLIEFLKCCEVHPVVEDLKDYKEYAVRLGGWINRLNEIRERLKCSVCAKPMVNNFKYSRNLAAYASTIVSCDEGKGHDYNIYLSHCWACREHIDSREGNFQVDGYYLCIKCGSGPRRSVTYSQGSICPKCGSEDIHPLTKGQCPDYKCNYCGHMIQIPTKNNITGLSRYER